MPGRRIVRIAVSFALLAFASAATFAGADPGMLEMKQGVIDLRADLEAGASSAFHDFECPDVSRQFRLDTTIKRGHGPSARFEEQPGDVWANGTIRCLVADYDSGETVGDDYYYGFSVYIPSGAIDDGNVLWELHQGEELYRHLECAVAPYALYVKAGSRGEGLQFRVAGGNCVLGHGWSLWRGNMPIPGLNPLPHDTWIDFLIHIRFQESPTGVVELWYRRAGAVWPTKPAITLRRIPTVPRCDACPVHDASLYTELGLYAGATSTSIVSVVYIADYRRGTTFDVVRDGFPSP